jgi:hypothetical protein
MTVLHEAERSWYLQVAGAHQRVAGLLAGLQTFEQYAHMCTLAACGAAVVRSRALPAKLNSLLQPLMAALRKEPEPQLQVCDMVWCGVVWCGVRYGVVWCAF